jgi:two-component system, LytTR family, sensor kinase
LSLSFDTFRKNNWAASFLFWQVSALIFILHRYFTNLFDQVNVNWPAYIASLEALHVSLALITVPVFRRLSRKPPTSLGSWALYSIMMAIAISVLATILFTLLIVLTPSHLNINQDDWPMRIQRSLVASPVITWVVSVVMLVGFSAWRFFEQHQSQLQRESKLKEDLAQAQMQMLRMQVNPHFLFNTFNTISMMIRTGRSADANNMLAMVADLFRSSLQNRNHDLVPLREEIKLCEQFLNIERIRFADRLEVKLTVDATAGEWKVPSLILQPLIENAFKHGLMENLSESQSFHLDAALEGKILCIQIKNTGRLKSNNQEGIGLKNVKERLKIAFGQNAALSLSEQNGWVIAKIEIKS